MIAVINYILNIFDYKLQYEKLLKIYAATNIQIHFIYLT